MVDAPGTFDMESASRMVVARVQEMQAQPLGTLDTTASAAAQIDLNDFCSIWLAAKPILQTLVSIIRLIPGVPAVAGAVLTALIELGDRIYASQCGA